MLEKRRRKFEGIDPKSWEHPADTAALSAVRQLKGVDDIIKVIVSLTSERSLKLMALASTVKVTENQYPHVNRIVDDIVETFDWGYRPTVFLTQSPFLNAGVLGVDEPFILINSSIMKEFDEREISAIVAHEMGHIMSGHSLYKTVIWLLTNISLNAIPVPAVIVYALLAVLSEWNRKSELSADRVELLALQEETTSYNILMKMAGAADLSQVNLNEFFLQAQEYENQKTLIDSIHKILNQVWMSHPYPVVRLQELKTWASSGFYQSILEGNYLRRDFHKSTVDEDVKAAYDYYKETFTQSDDPVFSFIGNLGAELEKATAGIAEGFEKTTEDIRSKLKDVFNPGGSGEEEDE
jgi:Zn-dependent protease with chaperone function